MHYRLLTRSRIESLEAQMLAVNGKLDGIVTLLRDLIPQTTRGQRARETPPVPSAEPVQPDPSSKLSVDHYRDTGPVPQTIDSSEQSLSSLEKFVQWIHSSEADDNHGASSDLTIPVGPPQSHAGTSPLATRSLQHIDNPPQEGLVSEVQSSDEDDPLDAAVRMESLRSMTQREEAARLRKEGHAEPRAHFDPGTAGSGGSTGNASRKRSRADGDGESDRLVRHKGDLSRSFLNPVQLGICSETEGRALFDS